MVLKVNGNEVASGVVPVSAPLIFTANDCLDFGIDLGSPVGIEYYDQAPFKFNGTVEGARVEISRYFRSGTGRETTNGRSDSIAGLVQSRTRTRKTSDSRQFDEIGRLTVSVAGTLRRVQSARRGSEPRTYYPEGSTCRRTRILVILFRARTEMAGIGPRRSVAIQCATVIDEVESAFVPKRTRRGIIAVSAFGGKADIPIWPRRGS